METGFVETNAEDIFDELKADDDEEVFFKPKIEQNNIGRGVKLLTKMPGRVSMESIEFQPGENEPKSHRQTRE